MWRVNCWNASEVTQQQITKTGSLLLKKNTVFFHKNHLDISDMPNWKHSQVLDTLLQGYFSKVCPVFLGWDRPWKIPLSPKLKHLILTMLLAQESWHMLVSLRLKKKIR